MASTPWTWSLQLVRKLLPVARKLPQFPRRPRGNPRLAQPSHPQQVGKISRIPLIVLDPAVAERLAPGGRARCTPAPASATVSTAQYHARWQHPVT